MKSLARGLLIGASLLSLAAYETATNAVNAAPVVKSAAPAPKGSYAEQLYQQGLAALNAAKPDRSRAVRLLKQASAAGVVPAMLLLADLYTNNGIPADYVAAEKLLNRAVEAGAVKEGQRGLGRVYEAPLSPRHDPARAAAAYSVAADLGDAVASVALARMMVAGQGDVAFDFGKAKTLLEAALKAGDTDAWHVLGDLYRNPKGQPDNVKAAEAYQKAIDLDDGAAALELAKLLAEGGDGLPADPARAHGLLLKAMAIAKVPEQWTTIGKLFQTGPASLRDPQRAAEAFQHAVDLGDANSVYPLVDLLARGGDNGAPLDFDGARKLVQSLVTKDPAVGWNMLGDLYLKTDAPHRSPTNAADAYRKAIALGSPGAMMSLAQMLGTGDGVRPDFPQAVSLLQRSIAADKTSPWPWATLASLYQNGDPAFRDLTKARDAYQHSVELGNPWAAMALGDLLANGSGGSVDPLGAEALLQKAIASGDEVAKWAWSQLAGLYRRTDTPLSNPGKAADAYRHAIALGNLGANLDLAGMLRDGAGVPKDFDGAKKLINDAIQGGEKKNGWAALGDLYRSASGAQRNMPEAIKAFRAAVDLGNGFAALSLAGILAHGDGTAVDTEGAKALLQVAIDNGAAQGGWGALGDLYLNGDPAQRDAAAAAAAYKKSADLGSAWSLISLARLTTAGDGVPRDFDQAKAMLEKAAATDANAAPVAFMALADLYNGGDAEHRDIAKALTAYQQAANLGNPWARLTLARIFGNGESGVTANFDVAIQLAVQATQDKDAAAQAWSLQGDLYAADGAHHDQAKATDAYLKAADLKDASAMTKLASIYTRGDGVAKDLPKAEVFLKQAIAAGNASQGWNLLGDLYRDADAAHFDAAKMVAAYESAIQAGNVQAMISLGKIYIAGRLVPADYDKASALFKQAITAGDPANGGKLLGDLYLSNPADKDSAAKALDPFRTAAAAGNGDANLAAAKLESSDYADADQRGAMVDHLSAAAKVLGADTVATTMMNFDSGALYASVQEMLDRAGKNPGRRDGTMRKQTSAAIKSFCTDKKIDPCETEFVTVDLLKALLQTP